MTPTPQQIIEAVCRMFSVNELDMTSKSRKVELVKARIVSAWLMRTVRKDSYPFIASVVGFNSHNGARDGCLRVERSKELSDIAMSLCRTLTNQESSEVGPRYSMRTQEILRTINTDAQVRSELMAHLRHLLIGQIVAEHTPTPP